MLIFKICVIVKEEFRDLKNQDNFIKVPRHSKPQPRFEVIKQKMKKERKKGGKKERRKERMREREREKERKNEREKERKNERMKE
jgi:hypothetical protein